MVDSSVLSLLEKFITPFWACMFFMKHLLSLELVFFMGNTSFEATLAPLANLVVSRLVPLALVIN